MIHNINNHIPFVGSSKLEFVSRSKMTSVTSVNNVTLIHHDKGQLQPFQNSPNPLNELISNLRKVFENDNVNIEQVQSLMEAYQSSPEDWENYAKFDKSFPYTKNLVDEGNGKYDLILVCWSKGQGFTGSPIHDHANSHCFMKIAQGALTEVRYAWPEGNCGEGSLKETSRNTLNLNSVHYMSDELGLHRMENALQNEQSVSLHLYIPPIMSCHTFDKDTSQKTKCQVTFWSKYGKKV